MEPLYRVILKKSWEVIWKHKFLWIFGVFALWLGNGGEMQIFMNTMHSVEEISASNIPFNIKNIFLLDVLQGANGALGILNWLIMILIILIIISIIVWIIVIFQVAIINAVNNIVKNEKTGFKKALGNSREYFFRVLGLNILSKFLISLIVLVIAVPLLIISLQSFSNVRFLIMVIVWLFFLPLAMIISFIIKYAINFVIIKKEKFWSSVSKAWFLFRSNWLISMEMVAFLLIINTVVGLIVIYVTMIILGPYNMDMLVMYAISSGDLSVIFLKVLPLLALYLFSGTFIAIFQTTSWTILFNELISSKRYGKLVRMVASLSNYMKTSNQILKKSDINDLPDMDKLKRRRGRPKVKS